VLLKKCKYDPAIYGQLRADYLNRLSGSYRHNRPTNDEENRRQELIKEIKEGKLGKRK
jgi:hypothetical protein